jgi:hypothetical protein
MKTIKPARMAFLVSVVVCIPEQGAPTMSAPSTTTAAIFMAPELAATVMPFLDGGVGAKSWSAQVAEHR